MTMTPREVTSVVAEYRTAAIPHHRGNPLIEALPELLDARALFDALTVTRVPTQEELSLPSAYRMFLPGLADQAVLPLPEYHEFYALVMKALCKGYAAKNPFAPETIHYRHFLDYEDGTVSRRQGSFVPNGTTICVVGNSGVGKTTMLRDVFSLMPQVIRHSNYMGRTLPLDQVVWLEVRCPDTATPSEICESVIAEIDRVTGTGSRSLLPKRSSQSQLANHMEMLLRRYSVGIIALDEMQNLKRGEKLGPDAILRFLLNRMNHSGVPHIFMGNPDFTALLKLAFRTARRAESGGVLEFGPLRPKVWKTFVSHLFRAQWTTPNTPCSDELTDCLREISQGNIDIAVRTFVATQELLIGSESELITSQALAEGGRRATPLTKRSIDLIRRNDPEIEVVNRDYSLSIGIESDEESRSSGRCRSDMQDAHLNGRQRSAQGKNRRTIPGDPERIHHDEFRDRIIAARESTNLICEIDSPHAIRNASAHDDPHATLRAAGITPGTVEEIL